MTDKKVAEPNLDETPVEASIEAPILTAAEIEAIKKQARAEILTAKKKSAKESLLTQEKARLEREEGFTTGNAVKDEIVSITIDLAEFGNAIVVNGQAFWHGHTYTVPRHVADSFRETMYRGWGHQAEIDGKSRQAFYAQKRLADMNKVKAGGVIVGKDTL